jgi:hypothetical protein
MPTQQPSINTWCWQKPRDSRNRYSFEILSRY